MGYPEWVEAESAPALRPKIIAARVPTYTTLLKSQAADFIAAAADADDPSDHVEFGFAARQIGNLIELA